MPVILYPRDAALRLALAVLAGALLGFDRGEQGRPAGMRTTLLVCLAAAVSMLQANALMGAAGKAKDSFVVLDLMRLPLGILSGMGFIGAGAIIRRGNLVVGVTTAATLWFVTVVGLCFGGGQVGIGSAATGMGLAVVWGLKRVEGRMHRERMGALLLKTGDGGPTEAQVRAAVAGDGYRIVSWAVSHSPRDGCRTIRCEVRWRARADDTQVPSFVDGFARQEGVLRLSWKP